MFNKILGVVILLFSFIANAATSLGGRPQFLTPEQAFQFSSEQKQDELFLHFQIAPHYLLYKDKIIIKGKNASIGKVDLPKGVDHEDEFFGKVQVYENSLDLVVPIVKSKNGIIDLEYQGCTEGFCYPPENISINLNDVTSTRFTEAKKVELGLLDAPVDPSNVNLLWFLVLGIGLAFTPCVLPMLPLLSSLVIGSKEKHATKRASLLSFAYIQGVALVFTILGLLSVAFGTALQAALQSVYVLFGFSALFVILALSMFGLFEIKLPQSLQQKMHNLNANQKQGSILGVFLMGATSGLIASPCISAPLAGVLLYISQTGDFVIGSASLYLLALGMGIPLMLATLFGNKILPRTGEWMVQVKVGFGFVMLALPVFLVSRVLSITVEVLLWSSLAIAFLVWLLSVLAKHTSFVARLFKVLALVGFAFASHNWVNFALGEKQLEPVSVKFTQVDNIDQLNQIFAMDKGKKILLDFRADWCVACRELEKYTFPNSEVKATLENFVVLKVDLTKNTEANKALRKHFNVLGTPTIIFFDSKGNEIENKRIFGFLKPEIFNNWLNNL